MLEVRLHGRYGQPVGKVTRAMGQKLMAEGKHVQVFDGFGAFRLGAPMTSTVRVSDEAILERSAENTNPDVVIVLDNSLFEITDVAKGLKNNGVVMAAGVQSDVLGAKSTNFKFIQLEVKNKENLEEELLSVLKQNAVL